MLAACLVGEGTITRLPLFPVPCRKLSPCSFPAQKSYEKQPSRAPVTQSHVCLTTSASSELPHAAPARTPIVVSTPPTPAPNVTHADPPCNAPRFPSRQKLLGSVPTAPPRCRGAGTAPVHTGGCTQSNTTQLQKFSI